jgi:hypothetical protein
MPLSYSSFHGALCAVITLSRNVTQSIDQFGQPRRANAAHWMAAAVALVGAVAIQWMWPAAVHRDDDQHWWVLLLSATAYLLATFRFHYHKTQWRPHELVPRMWSLGRWLLCDLIIGLLAGIALAKGHDALVIRAGLWLLPPTLLAVSGASALAAVVALREGMNWLRTDILPAEAPITNYRRDVLRFVCFVWLAVLLLVVS